MRRILATGGLLALAAPLLLLAPSMTEPAHAYGEPGIGWKYHEGSRSYYQDPPSAPGESGPAQRPTRYVDWGKGDMESYACPAENYDGSPFECGGENDPTNDFCNSNPGENGRPVAPRVIFEREFDNPAQTGNPPWRPLPPADWDAEHFVESCHELPEEYVVTPAEIQEDVNYEVFQDLSGLEVVLPPKGRTLVNLATIVYTPYPANVDQIPEVIDWDVDQPRPSLTIVGHVEGKIQDFQYRIDARADLAWTFENGVPGTATGRGRPFDGTLPEDAPAGYYVTAHFTKAKESNIRLGAVWTGEVTVETPGGPRTEALDPVPIAAPPTPIQVSEAKSVITN